MQRKINHAGMEASAPIATQAWQCLRIKLASIRAENYCGVPYAGAAATSGFASGCLFTSGAVTGCFFGFCGVDAVSETAIEVFCGADAVAGEAGVAELGFAATEVFAEPPPEAANFKGPFLFPPLSR